MYRISAIRCLVHLEKCLLDDYYRDFSFVDIYTIVQLCWKIEVIDYRSSSFGILTHTMVKRVMKLAFPFYHIIIILCSCTHINMLSFVLYNVTVHEIAYMPTMYTKLFRFLNPSILEILLADSR